MALKVRSFTLHMPRICPQSFNFQDIALSSGSACTSASLEPSYVLRALGAQDDMAHSSLRFGIGRFTTEAEVDYVIEKIVAVVQRLRDMRYAVPPLIALLYPLTATTVARCGRWSKRALTLTPSTGPSIKLG